LTPPLHRLRIKPHQVHDCVWHGDPHRQALVDRDRHRDEVAGGDGHEVACHGYAHRLVYRLGPARFRDDVSRAKRVLEDCLGQRVAGFRAASYSIVESTLWALDVLIEEGFEYDSSVFPVRHDIYGIPGFHRFAVRLRRAAGDIIEVDWDYTGPGSPVGFSLWVNGANIGFSDLGGCSFGGGTGTCFFHASDTVCSPVLQVKGSFVPGGEKFASPIQIFFYRGNDPASFSCLPSPPQCAGDQAGGSVGGPINVVTGNMHYEAVDIEVPSPLPIRIARRYDTQRSYSGPMGASGIDTTLGCNVEPTRTGSARTASTRTRRTT
jgi:hypothetical protein